MCKGQRGVVVAFVRDLMAVSGQRRAITQLASGDFVSVGVIGMRHTAIDGTEVKLHQFLVVLAWAMTVHRLQGMGLDCLITTINRGNIFEPAAAYVALGRATGRLVLYLKHFDRRVVVAFDTVRGFHKRQRAFLCAFGIVLGSVRDTAMVPQQKQRVSVLLGQKSSNRKQLSIGVLGCEPVAKRSCIAPDAAVPRPDAIVVDDCDHVIVVDDFDYALWD